MWYAMQVRTGTEANILQQCCRQIPGELLERCFLPYYEEKKHIQGTWITQKKVLFPGYLFVVTEHMPDLYEELRSIIGLTRVLKTGDEIVPLLPDEVRYLLTVGGEDQIIHISEGIIEGGVVHILAGPLYGQEARIRRIDRHKRLAWLELEMFGKVQTVKMGLEILEKR